jgi:hypothetical protein
MLRRAAPWMALVFSALVVGWITIAHSQSKPDQKLKAESMDLIKKLVFEKADISKMDWILLNAKLDALRDVFKDDLAQPMTLTGFGFDRGRTVIKVYVNPDWLARNSITEVGNAFKSRAPKVMFSVFDNLWPEAVKAGVPVNQFADFCSVEFLTFHSDKETSKIIPETVAVYEEGKLELK